MLAYLLTLLMNPKLFPTIMMVLAALAAVVWFLNGNMRMGLYWLLVAAINACLTY
jgi:hypothetical protein